MGMHSVQVVAVTGGKGGIGKTNVTVNLAIALAEMGRRVMLLDADLGLANVDILLGISPKKNLYDVLSDGCDLTDIMVTGPKGIKIVPAASGIKEMTHLTSLQHAGLINAFNDISDQVDILLIDTAAGISDTVMSFVCAAQEILLVVCNEPTSITDTYAMVKMLNRDHHLNRFHVLANMTRSIQETKEIYEKLVKVTDRFLDVTLQYAGAIPYDENIRKSVQRQKAVCEAYPRSKSSLAFKSLARKVNAWPLPSVPRGNLEFFVERLVQGIAS